MVVKKNKHKITSKTKILLITLSSLLILIGVFFYWFYFLRPAIYFKNMHNKLSDLSFVAYEGSVLLKGSFDSSEVNTKFDFQGIADLGNREYYLKIIPDGFFDSLLVDSEFEIFSDQNNYYLKINSLPQILKLYLGEVNLENRWAQISKAQENKTEISLEKIDYGKVFYQKSDTFDNRKTLVLKSEIKSNNIDEVFNQDSIKAVFTENEISYFLESLKKKDIYYCYFWIDPEYQLRKFRLNLPLSFQEQELELDINVNFKKHNNFEEIIFPDIYEKAENIFGILERK